MDVAESGELLYNGIRLPAMWPPRLVDDPRHLGDRWGTGPRRPLPVPYLAHPPAVIPIDVGRQLLVDDFLVASTDLTRRFHRPARYDGNPVLTPATPLEWGEGLRFGGDRGPSATVFQDGLWFDPQDQRFKLWYNAGAIGGGSATAYAVSADGLHWERPELDVLPGTNAVLTWPPGHARDGCAVWLDHGAADLAERFKAYAFDDHYRTADGCGGDIYCSPDGIHWTRRATTSFVHQHSDNSTIHYNPFRRKWVYSLRGYGPGNLGRVRWYRECDDLLRGACWAPEDLVLWAHADDLDLPDPAVGDTTQLYNLDMIAYESLMLGVIAVHRGPSNEVCAREGRPKLTDLTLAYSRDGFHWHRPDRTAFLAATRQPGDWDRGYLHSAASVCTVVGDQLWFYYGGWSGSQQPWAGGGGTYCGGATGVAMLRRDGFASLEAGARGGTLTTRPVTFRGQYLWVNLQASQGELRVEVLDADGRALPGYEAANCLPVQGDATRLRVAWQDRGDLAGLAGRPVRFRFQLRSGALFAFWVSPSAAGHSHGYVAAGGPGFTGPRDDGEATD